MRTTKALLSIITGILLLWVAGCKTNSGQAENPTPGSQTIVSTPTPAPTRDPHELTREAIAPLIRGQLTQTLEGVMPQNGWARLYRSLVEAKILDCSFDQIGMCYDCKVGANGRNIRVGNLGRFIVPIGRKVPAVTGVSRIDSTSGVAQVSLTFQPSNVYDHFRSLSDAFILCVSRSGQATQQTNGACDTQNEQSTVHLRLYEDGWRVEKVD